MKDFHDLFIHELKDIYAAELLIEQTLPEMAKEAHSPELKKAFHAHHQETKEQIQRLDKIAGDLSITLKPCECAAIESMLKEGKKLLRTEYPQAVRDAALITCAQKIKHYEICVYGILKAFAKHLGLDDIVRILDETSKEEGTGNKKLTEIAEGTLFGKGVNAQALKKSA